MSEELLRAGGVRREAKLWVPHRPSRAPDIHDLYHDVEDVIENEINGALFEEDGNEVWCDYGHSMAVEVLITEDPMTATPVLSRLMRERRAGEVHRACAAHLTELDRILEGGRGQSVEMTWANVTRYVGRALLLGPSAVAVTPRT